MTQADTISQVHPKDAKNFSGAKSDQGSYPILFPYSGFGILGGSTTLFPSRDLGLYPNSYPYPTLGFVLPRGYPPSK